MLKSFTKNWYSSGKPNFFLNILANIYRFTIYLRQLAYRRGLLQSYKVTVPVIVVGNITVGGTGKTPLIIALAKAFKQRGVKVGIISRGYQSQCTHYPHEVKPSDDPNIVGDEPYLIACKTQCPMVIAPDRVAAAKQLIKSSEIDVILSDDGLQHYALQRDLEICVIDGERRFGNQACLPAGPLREPISRLGSVDYVVCNGESHQGEITMTLISGELINLNQSTANKSINDFKNICVHAVAGIGNPQRFFNTLSQYGLNVNAHEFSDHHRYTPEDFAFDDGKPIIMTEKDAVKCRQFAKDNFWVSPITAVVPEEFIHELLQRVNLPS